MKTGLNNLIAIAGFCMIILSCWFLTFHQDIKQTKPIWQSQLSGGAYGLFVVDSVLFLARDNYLYKINKVNGEVIGSKGRSNTFRGQQMKANRTSTTYLTHSFDYTFEGIHYKIIERFKVTDSCTEYLHRYQLEVIDPLGEKEQYFLGESDYYFVSEFAWIGKQLYIIKTSSSGGDAMYLEKYDLS
ncbi:MAG: hypothetical protein AAFY76_06265 [Cyanobacteria bacterium J06649_11]